MKLYKTLMIAALTGGVMASCHNADNEFPDFEYQTVYFAHPAVGRTIELGDAFDVDLTLDNQHKFQVKAVRGGAYSNNANRVINYAIDPTLLDNVYFDETFGGHKVELLPEEYYEILDSKIVIPAGRIDGGVTVQLTDAFFNDPKALDFNYALPMVMTSVEGTDSILQGKKLVENPNRLVAGDWSVAPMDFVLYCVRFVNEWNGRYLRRGKDRITASAGASPVEVVRHKEYVERDEEVTVSTSAYRSCDVALTTQTDADHTYKYTLRLNFSEDGTCAVTSATGDLTVSGTGKFLKKSEKKAISGVDRDGLYLDYTVSDNSGWTVAVSDTLVMRDRNVSAQYPSVVVNQ